MRRRQRSTFAAAEILRELDRQRMSTELLSDKTGVSLSVLNRKLTGNGVFDLDEIDAIAGALGVPVAALIRTAENY